MSIMIDLAQSTSKQQLTPMRATTFSKKTSLVKKLVDARLHCQCGCGEGKTTSVRCVCVAYLRLRSSAQMSVGVVALRRNALDMTQPEQWTSGRLNRANQIPSVPDQIAHLTLAKSSPFLRSPNRIN